MTDNIIIMGITPGRKEILFNAGTGVELASWRRNAVNIGIGYRYQKITFKRLNYWVEETTNELVTSYNRIEVQFGFIFR